MSETHPSNHESEPDSQEPSGFDALSQNSEENWREMQEMREKAKEGRFRKIGQKIMNFLNRALRRQEQTSNDTQVETEINSSTDTLEDVGVITEDATAEPNTPNTTESEEVVDRENIIIGDVPNDWGDASYETTKSQKEKRARAERVREDLERTINESFTPVEELVGMAEAGAEGAKRLEDVEYQGKKIPVYNMGNLPFYFLQHSIQFYGRSEQHQSNLFRDPSFWDLPKDEARKVGGTNMFSMYFKKSTEKAESDHLRDTVRYGILDVPPQSLFTVTEQSTITSNDEGKIALKDQTGIKREDLIDKLAKGGLEIQGYRYDSNQKAQYRPSFIIAPESGINEATKKHAAYFDVPIFIIPTKHVETEEEKAKKQQEKEKRIQEIHQEIESEVEKAIAKFSESYQGDPEAEAKIAKFERTIHSLAANMDAPGWENGYYKIRYRKILKLLEEQQSLEK